MKKYHQLYNRKYGDINNYYININYFINSNNKNDDNNIDTANNTKRIIRDASKIAHHTNTLNENNLNNNALEDISTNDIDNSELSNNDNKINIGENLYCKGIKLTEKAIKDLINVYKKDNSNIKNIKNKINNEQIKNLYESNLQYILNKEQKMDKLRKEKQEKEISECSFKPKINKNIIIRNMLTESDKNMKLNHSTSEQNKIIKNKTPEFKNKKYLLMSFSERNEYLLNYKKEKEKEINYVNYNVYKNKTDRINKLLLKDKARTNVYNDLHQLSYQKNIKKNEKINEQLHDIKKMSNSFNFDSSILYEKVKINCKLIFNHINRHFNNKSFKKEDIIISDKIYKEIFRNIINIFVNSGNSFDNVYHQDKFVEICLEQLKKTEIPEKNLNLKKINKSLIIFKK